MKTQEPTSIFSQNNAASYDKQREKLAPLKDALHLCIRMLLSKLPSDARVLCVGVGTGSELIYLASAFPQWQFTVVEPASAMLDLCRNRAIESGISTRCTFHEGYLDSLPDSSAFDVATSILVSHFFVNPDDRTRYFSEIALRLIPGAYLINADLASDMSTFEYKSLLKVWLNMHEYAGMPVNIDSFGHHVAILPIEEVESIIALSGFDTPVLFFQTLLIHAWFSKVNSAR